jgi:hypothetical protein
MPERQNHAAPRSSGRIGISIGSIRTPFSAACWTISLMSSGGEAALRQPVIWRGAATAQAGRSVAEVVFVHGFDDVGDASHRASKCHKE